MPKKLVIPVELTAFWNCRVEFTRLSKLLFALEVSMGTTTVSEEFEGEKDVNTAWAFPDSVFDNALEEMEYDTNFQ